MSLSVLMFIVMCHRSESISYFCNNSVHNFVTIFANKKLVYLEIFTLLRIRKVCIYYSIINLM